MVERVIADIWSKGFWEWETINPKRARRKFRWERKMFKVNSEKGKGKVDVGNDLTLLSL